MVLSRQRKLYRLYFLLAAFDVLTVCMGLYFSHGIMTIYTDSVEVNQTWAQRVAGFSRLGELAAAVNAPANDVFGSLDVHAESSRMQFALARFQAQFWTVRSELQEKLPRAEAASLVAKLDAVSQAMQDMTGEAQEMFAFFRAKQPAAAGTRMATMDRRYAEVNRALADLRASVATSQARNFEQQVAAAASQKKYQYALGALLLLMVVAAMVYGQRMARHAQAEAAERERNLAEISRAKAQLEASSQQKRAALEALQDTHARLQALFKRVLDAEEQQRQHLARELHEDVAQMLASLKMRLGSLDHAPGVGRHVRDAGSIAESVLARLQDLVRDLTPHGMEIVGLAGVLRVHLEEWTRDTGIAVCFSEHLRGRPPFRIENAAYRVVQEAVANVTRHANARRLEVELRSTSRELQLRVADDGVGFDVAAARRRLPLGLTLMEQRTAALGGKLEIRSATGRGTTVLAAFPLQQQIDWVQEPA